MLCQDNLAVVDPIIYLVLRGKLGIQMMYRKSGFTNMEHIVNRLVPENRELALWHIVNRLVPENA
jgi:hypothetical protein